LETAISNRVLDDQIKRLSEKLEIRVPYDIANKEINCRYSCMMFDEMTLREVCKKIIHAEVVERHINESEGGGHKIDSYNWIGW